MPEAYSRLTPRQRECLRLVYERRTSKEIATELGLQVGTVDTYVADAIATLGARNRRHAAEVFRRLDDDREGPGRSGPEKTGVADATRREGTPAAGTRPKPWFGHLPFRTLGANGNDIVPLLRLGWVVQLAICIAVGFGMLVVGLDVLARFFGKS